MKKLKKRSVKLAILFLLTAVFLGGCTSKDNSEVQKDNGQADNSLKITATENTASETAISEKTVTENANAENTNAKTNEENTKKEDLKLQKPLSVDEIPGNGKHFVQYEGKIYFRVPTKDNVQTVALWGNYDNIPEDMVCSVMAMDLETLDTEILFDDASHGPIVISNGRLILCGNNRYGEQPVRSFAIDGTDPKELPGTYIFGTLPSGKYFITGKYDFSDQKLHLYICSGDGTYKEVIPSEPLYDYAGLSDKQLLCITNGEGDYGNLAGYDLETGEETKYGPLPGMTESKWPGEPELMYAENDEIWLQLSTYEGSGHFFSHDQYVKIQCGIPDSLEEVIPDGTPVEEKDVIKSPEVILRDKKLVYVEGVPYHTHVDTDGNLGVFDENGDFVKIASGYDILEIQSDDTIMDTEHYEAVGGDIYLVRNRLQRAPEEDIGWRDAYERLETSVLRINIANGECITIDQR